MTVDLLSDKLGATFTFGVGCTHNECVYQSYLTDLKSIVDSIGHSNNDRHSKHVRKQGFLGYIFTFIIVLFT